MNAARYFMRREDYQERTTPADSPFRKFIIHCLKCGSYQLRVISTYDEEVGEHRVALHCPRCGQTEEI
jgi:transcription elongation factor Elf1